MGRIAAMLALLASAGTLCIAAPSPAAARAVPAAVPSTSPSPAALSAQVLAPLKEIGRVKATTTFCKTIVDHATAAVERGIDNDGKIALEVHALRVSDFDANALTKANALQLLLAYNSTLGVQAVAAEKAAKALRVDAASAPTPEQAKNLIAFAAALDGALHRQRTVARDVASMIAIFGHRPQMTKMERDELVIEAQRAENNRGSQTYMNVEQSVPPLLSSIASDAADQLVERQSGIDHDEREAAKLLEPVFSGC